MKKQEVTYVFDLFEVTEKVGLRGPEHVEPGPELDAHPVPLAGQSQGGERGEVAVCCVVLTVRIVHSGAGMDATIALCLSSAERHQTPKRDEAGGGWGDRRTRGFKVKGQGKGRVETSWG